MTETTELRKMIAGELYRPADAEIQAEWAANAVWLAEYNATMAAPLDDKRALLRKRFASVGDGAVIRPPFFCDFGWNVSIGRDAFMNFDCVILDVCAVSIGDGAQIGPAVHIYAADHPRDPELRRDGLEMGKPVAIGRNVWIGGGSRILPGVTIGDDAIVGAGSVVTRDVPAGATVVGVPARRIAWA